jgi:signal transduction histidine kinase
VSLIDASTQARDRFREARDAIELLVAVLSAGDPQLDRAAFYSRLAEGVARVTAMRRVIVFLFDEATWRVEAAGAYGIDLAQFADMRVSLERAADAARALREDQVIEVSPPDAHAIPEEFTELVGDHPLIYVPIAAGGRWPGLIIGEPQVSSPPLDEEGREFLWLLGKVFALALIARIATFHSERARELQQRIDLARDLHEGVVQRLFGVSMALSPPGALEGRARERCADELQVALGDLRAAIERPLRRTLRRTRARLAAELERLRNQPLGVPLEVDGPVPEIPVELEPLLQSVLDEALRNAQKHARARSLTVRVRRADELLVLEVENDGVESGAPRVTPGVGLRIAAIEALQAGGMLEFGEREPGVWQVRLAVPDGAP